MDYYKILSDELNIQKYKYAIYSNTITIILNEYYQNILVLSPSRNYLIMDNYGLDKIHITMPKNISCYAAKNYTKFTIKKTQNIVDSYIDLTSLYYEIQYLKNECLNKEND